VTEKNEARGRKAIAIQTDDEGSPGHFDAGGRAILAAGPKDPLIFSIKNIDYIKI